MPDFVPDLPAGEVDRHLRASLNDLRDAEKNAALWFAEMQRRRLYRDFGFGSMAQYAAVRLGFGKSKTYQFLRLAESLRELPHLRDAVTTGKIPWTKARTVAKVATPATETAWIQKAQGATNRDLEEQIRAARHRVRSRHAAEQGTLALGNPADGKRSEESGRRVPEQIPVDVHMRFSPEEYARYETLVEAIRKSGGRSSREQLFLAGLEVLLAQQQERGAPGVCAVEPSREADQACTPRYQIVIQLCESCETGMVATSRGPQEISPSELRVALCDGHVDRNGRRRSSIPPRLRRAALRRDRFRCRAAGCGSARFLAVHHRVMQSRGGKHLLENLVTLCASCHRAIHLREDRPES